MRAAFAAIAIVLALAGTARAVEPDEMLKDPAQEARAEAIGKQLRCPVCKTESIEESDADFTKDLRKLVREQVAAGKTNEQVLDYIHSRYGDFILLKPPFKPSTSMPESSAKVGTLQARKAARHLRWALPW